MPASNSQPRRSWNRRCLRRLREVGIRVGLLLCGLAAGLLLAEGLVRLAAPQQLIVLRPDIWIPDDGLGWKRAPGLDTRINTGEREVRLVTDESGRRAPGGVPPSAPKLRILALGDSFLEALQVEYGDSLAGRLSEGLARRVGGPVRVNVAGVAGYGPNHYLIQARRELARTEYDGVLVFLYPGNDVVKERRSRFPPKTPETRHEFRWPRSLQPRELIDSFLYPANDVLETRSHLFVLLRTRLPSIKSRLVALRHAAKKETTDPARLFADRVYNSELADSPRWALTAEICADIDALARRHGIPALFVLFPGKVWVEPEALATEARSLGIDPSWFDLEQPFQRLEEELDARELEHVSTLEAFRAARHGGAEELFGRVDTHLSPAGHRLLAREILPPFAELLESGAANSDRNARR